MKSEEWELPFFSEKLLAQGIALGITMNDTNAL